MKSRDAASLLPTALRRVHGCRRLGGCVPGNARACTLCQDEPTFAGAPVGMLEEKLKEW